MSEKKQPLHKFLLKKLSENVSLLERLKRNNMGAGDERTILMFARYLLEESDFIEKLRDGKKEFLEELKKIKEACSTPDGDIYFPKTLFE